MAKSKMSGIIIIVALIVGVWYFTQSTGVEAVSVGGTDRVDFSADVVRTQINPNDQLQVMSNLEYSTSLFPNGAIVEFCVDCYNLQAVSNTFGPGSNCDNLLGTVDQYPPSNPQETDLAENAYYYHDLSTDFTCYLTGGIFGPLSSLLNGQMCQLDSSVIFKPGILTSGQHKIYATVYKLSEKPVGDSYTEQFRDACTIARAGGYEGVGVDGLLVSTVSVSSDNPLRVLGKQDTLTLSQLNTYPPKDIARAACASQDQCNSDAECTTVKSLVDSGRITSTKSKEIIDTSAIFFSSASAAGGAIACNSVGAISAAATGGAGAIIFPLCAVAGGSLGLEINKIFDNFADKDYSQAAYCISKEESSSFFVQFAFFDVDGNNVKDGTDGMIIAGVAGGLVLLLVMRR